MRRNLGHWVLAAALLPGASIVVAPPAAAQVRIQFQWGSRDRPLRGHRYEAMRELAHELDGRAAEAVREAEINASRGGRAERRLLASMQDFARRAASFHERMDAYLESPWDLRGEVAGLAERVNRVNDRLRNASLFAHAFNDWQAAVDEVRRMEMVLQGQEVPGPAPRPDGGDEDRRAPGYGRFERDEGGTSYGSPDGYGDVLPQIRQLAQRLANEANEADEAAGGFESDDPNVGAAAGAIHHFAGEARGFSQRVGAGPLDPGRLRARVEELREDAQTATSRLQAAGLLGSVPDWNGVLGALNRLDQLTR